MNWLTETPDPKQPSSREFSRPEAWAIVGGVAIPIVAYFVLPAIPSSHRTVAGLSFGAVFFILAIAFLLRKFANLHEDISDQYILINKILPSVTSDPISGIMHKGAIRNVSLRVATIHTIFDKLVSNIPENNRIESLKEVGLYIGHDWGRDFVNECRRVHAALNTLDKKLALWSEYDATAGLGKFEFTIATDGHGIVTLNSGFLSDFDAVAPLDYFFEGYLEGTLEEILSTSLVVNLNSPSTSRHEQSTFRVYPKV